MKIINYSILVIGLCLIGYSLTLEPFNNYDLFQEKYLQLGKSSEENKSEKYFELREHHLTNKFAFFDYGCTMVVLSLFCLYVTRNNLKLSIYNSKLKIFSLGFWAFITTVISMYGRLFIDVSRESAPHWADSIGIPIYYIFETSIYFLIFFIINLIGLLRVKSLGQDLINYKFSFKNLNLYWYGTQFLVCAYLLFLCVYEGLFLFVFSLLLWLSFNYSMILGDTNEI